MPIHSVNERFEVLITVSDELIDFEMYARRLYRARSFGPDIRLTDMRDLFDTTTTLMTLLNYVDK